MKDVTRKGVVARLFAPLVLGAGLGGCTASSGLIEGAGGVGTMPQPVPGGIGM